MSFSERDYEHLVNAFLPRGPIWNRKRGGILDSVLFSLSSEAARIDARISSMLEESDPRTSVEELKRWFKDHGVPSACIAAIADPSLEQLRQELISKITSNASPTAKYFEDLAASLGYTIHVMTYDEKTKASSTEAEKLKAIYTLGIRVEASSRYAEITPEWDVSQPLARWGSSLLECLIRAVAPAHVDVQFQYTD